LEKWLQVCPCRNYTVALVQTIIPNEDILEALGRDDYVLALLHELPQPSMDGVLQEILNRFLRKRNVMGILPILGVEGEYKRQIQLCCLACCRLPEEDRVLGMDQIKFQGRE